MERDNAEALVRRDDLSIEDLAEALYPDKGRQPEDVLNEMREWFEWFDQLHMEVAWFELPISDMKLLSIFPSYYPLMTNNYKMARYLDTLLVSRPTTECIIAHPSTDQI